MPSITETGDNGQDGWGTGIYGSDANPTLPAGADGTAGESVTLTTADVALTDYSHFEARGGRGGYAGMGTRPSSYPSPDYVAGADGGAGGNGGAGGHAASVVDNITTANSVRASAWGGRGGHGGDGGNGSSNSAGLAAGGEGGNGGTGNRGGDALARLTDVDQTFEAFGYFELLAQAAGGQGGRGGQAGYGGNGDGPGSAGSPGAGGAGGNAVAEVLNSHIILPGGNTSLAAYATAGHGGGGGYGAMGGNWASYNPSHQPDVTAGHPGAAAGFARATVAANVVTGGDLANIVGLTAMVGQAVGGTGGLSGSGGVFAAKGANGTGVLSMIDNTVSLGGGDDELHITMVAFQGTVIDFSNNAFDGGAGFDTLVLSARFINEDGHTVSAIPIDLATQFSGFERVLGGSSGDHLIAAASGGSIDGGEGDDRLYGRQGVDQLAGGNGNDTLNGGAGIDTMTGGHGNDHFYVDNIGDVVIEAADQGGSDRVFASVSYALGAGQSIELMSTTSNAGTGAINLTGNELANTILGNAGANVLNGGGGADTLTGLGGNDHYYVDNVGDVVVEAAGQGTSDRVFASVSYALGAGQSIELMSTTNNAGTAAIDLTGNELANTILGNAGANVLNGRGGADKLTGLGGNDTYYIDEAGDTVFEAAGGGDDTVITYKSFTLGAGQEVELLRTPGSATTSTINLTGNELANMLLGNAGTNTLNGGGGGDVLRGYAGDDTYYVDHAGDSVIEAAGGGNDTVIASASHTLGAGQHVETLRTFGSGTTYAIDLAGNELANTLLGNAAANTLNGRGGTDALRGYGGADTFVFNTALGAGNIDTILDFSAADDTIAIDNAVFAGLPAGALATGAFRTGAAATDADDRIIYNGATGQLLFDVDGVGGAAAVQFAMLTGAPAINASDFLVV